MKLIDLSFCSSHYSNPEIKPKQDSGHGGEKATSMAWIVQNMKPTCFGIKNKKNKMKKKKKPKQKKEKRNQQPKKTANPKGLITLQEMLPVSPTVKKDKGRPNARSSHQVRSGEDQMYTILPLQTERLFSEFESVTSRSHDNNLTIAPMLIHVEKDNSNKNICEEEEEDEDYGLKHVGSGRRGYVSRHDSMEYSTVSLEELLNSSDCNTSMDTESMSYYSDSISRDFSNISLEKLLKDARLEVEEKEIMYSFNGSQSGKEKKKVRFRLPEASDIFILNSPLAQEVVDSKE